MRWGPGGDGLLFTFPAELLLFEQRRGSARAELGGSIRLRLGMTLLNLILKFVSLLSCVKSPTKLKLRLV